MAEYFPYGEVETDYLSGRDPVLGAAIARIGPVRREVIPDLFQALLHSVVGQQISAKAARTVWERVRALPGGLTPEALLGLPPETIQGCGMSRRKVGYLRGIARAVVEGELALEALVGMEDEEVVKTLVALPGIGVWTAQMLMIFSMRRPNIISWLDLGIRKGMCRLYGLEELDRGAFDECARGYAPYGSVASLYLWHVWGEREPIYNKNPR